MKGFLGISELSRQLRLGRQSAVEACSESIEAARSSSTGAFSDVVADRALLDAEASDARRRKSEGLGELDGIPIAIKDLIDTHPAVCKSGLKHLSTYKPATDAVVVQRLRKAGAVIIGVTETDPGAFSTETLQVTNPLARDRIAGGSSGGSAAAVAAGIVPGSIGTDTGGSIRIPAACCSIYGFKPTWGRVDDRGVRPLARSLDHVGPLALNVADLRLLQSVLEGRRPQAHGLSYQRRLNLGTSEAYFADADLVITEAMKHIMMRLSNAGATIQPLTLPDPDDVLSFHMVNLPKEAADYHQRHFPTEWTAYPDIARATVLRGTEVTDEEYARAEERRRQCRAEVDAAVAGVDAIVLPTMPVDAPFRGNRSYDLGGRDVSKLEATIRYTALFNQSGHPCISMPAFLLSDGRALSIQLVGKRGEDDRLLSLAQDIEGILSLQIDYAEIIAAQSPAAYAAGGAHS